MKTLPLQVQYEKMSQLIIDAHLGQKYGDKPYTYHLRMVEEKAQELFSEHLSEKDQLKLSIASLGHDLAEDTKVTVDSLLDQGFDVDTLRAIGLVTKREGVGYKEYLRALSRDLLAWRVKVADTYSNLTESIKDGNMKRSRKYSKQLELLYKFKD